MKLSEFKGEESLILMADLLDPATVIFSDKKISEAYASKNNLIFAKELLKLHSREIIQIFAILNKESYEEYEKKVTLPQLFSQLLELINDDEIKSLFTSQGLKTAKTSTISAMENIEA